MSLGQTLLWASRNGDFSVAQVLDSKKTSRTWRGQVHPEYFYEVLYALGNITMRHLYASRIIHTGFTCTRLGKDMALPQLILRFNTIR